MFPNNSVFGIIVGNIPKVANVAGNGTSLLNKFRNCRLNFSLCKRSLLNSELNLTVTARLSLHDLL